ncbi:hypothetical protein T265_10681 [Opisthorchis viverrini]|uniref:Laminin EGF-like protein n=1 Tax=Opisthorchis viverrini TaxID=6198 RepID=A0A074ZCC3_OPIVI|nr:hypothetical protein T265_10681 [Opisthorchis viverrini]KER20855.1 hypothetical protein T265_10681 [Opisthorchis viverrini]
MYWLMSTAGLLSLILFTAYGQGYLPYTYDSDFLDMDPDSILEENAEITANATCGEHRREYYCRLVEHADGALIYKRLERDRRQVMTYFQQQPRSYRDPSGQWVQCSFCDARNESLRHPIEFVRSGEPHLWWQSPSLAEGLKYHAVYQIVYVLLRMGDSPRPANWILERSLDGQNYKPWVFFAESEYDCKRLYEPLLEGALTVTSGPRPWKLEDDEVYCTTYYSQPQALQSGEIIVTLSLDRASTISTTLGLERAVSPKLIDFLSARYVRLRFQKLQTLSGDWMAMPNQLDSSVYNRYYYSIRTIKVGGKCICNSHANRCEQRVVDGVPRAVCVCQHNTCGTNCETCCPMFNQQPWRPGRVCEECNCHGKADSCVFNQTVANLRLSQRKDGVFEGGGVCVDCREDTTGINCESCKPGYYRPLHVRPDSPHPCVKCECDTAGSTGVCVSNEREIPNRYPGDCICKEGFAGKRCDQCAEGYRRSDMDPSKCVPCTCDVRGSSRGGSYRCEPPCNCKVNVNPDSYCRECQPGYFNLDAENPEGCQPCYCSGLTDKCDGISPITALTLEQNGLLGAVSTLNGWSILFPGTSTDSGYLVSYRDDNGGEGESSFLLADVRIVESWLSAASLRPIDRGYYWSAPTDYLGKQLTAYRSQLTVILRFNSPTMQAFGVSYSSDTSRRISTSSLAIRDQLDAMWLSEPDIVLEGNGYRLAYMLPPDYRANHLIIEIPLSESSFRVLVEPPSSVPLDRIPIDLSQGSLASSRIAPYGGSNGIQLPGRPATIADMVAVLSKLDRFLIKVKYISDQATIELRQVKLERAERDPDGRIPSLEECICPVGHTGTSCESCAFGYWRSQDVNVTTEQPTILGMWRGQVEKCVPCECHGHSAHCDERTGKCTDCQHNTAGDKCELCAPGFYGDPKSGSPTACQPCECPNLANKKTDSCVANEQSPPTDLRPYLCLDCEDFTRGRYCELCIEGYYGQPEKGIPCRKCDCGRGAVGCNGTTGLCICGFNTAGPRCDACAEGTHGDPLLGQACRPCNCHEMGSVSPTCRLGDGQCTCRPGYEGVRCDRCVAGRGNVDAGCPPCQCSPLGTQQNVRPPCDQVTGQCVCKHGFGGTLDCSKCAPGYYSLGPDTCTECMCSSRAIDRVCDPEDGRCKCGENVVGITCDKCKAGYFWNVTGPNCLACDCGIGTIVDGTVGGAVGCDMQTGQCRCAPHVTGRQCTECEPGYFGVSAKGCQPCPSCPNGQLCDQITGKCICPPNTQGDRCEECTKGSWDYNPVTGCKDCNCSEVGSVSGADTTCDLVSGKCSCKRGYTGRACDQCDAGYYGYPNCRPCECDPAGSLRPNGTESTITLCNPTDGSCFCKANVQGDRCDECKPGTFGLNIDYPLGCYTCFCFPSNQKPKCSLLTGFRSSRGREKGVEIIASDHSSTPGGALIQLDIGLKDRGHNDLTVGVSQFNWRFSDHRPTFLEIPELKGPLTRNYGSVVIELLTECLPMGDCHLNPPDEPSGFVVNGGAGVGPNTDVAGSLIVRHPYRVDAKMVAFGGRVQLEYQPSDDAPSAIQDGYRQIWLRESDWVLTRVVDVDTRVRPSRNELMLALMNVTSFSVRLFMPEARPKLVTVKYRIYQAMSEMKTSVGTPIRSIEKCECPSTSSGDHCEIASSGFYFPPLIPKPGTSLLPPDPSAPAIRDSQNIQWTGGVEKCRCHGMSSHCDPVTGVCQACTGNTVGPDCGQCAEGYFGDPKKGQTCVKCQCPTEQTDYAITCTPFQDRPYVAHQCVCKPGYTGPRCERCAPGYFGDPLSMIACQPCECDLSGSKSANCDQRTGACDCWPGIQGRRCDQCEPDHVVDAGRCRDCRGPCTGELLIKADEVKAQIDNLNMTSLAYQGLARLRQQAEGARKRFSKERATKEQELVKHAHSVAKQTGEIRALADRVMATRNAIEVARCSSTENVTQLQKTAQRFEHRVREWIQRIEELSVEMPDERVLQRWLEQARKVNTDLSNINLDSTQEWLDKLMDEINEVISSAEQLSKLDKYSKTTADLERLTAYQSQQVKLHDAQIKLMYEISNSTARGNVRLNAAQEKSDALKKAATEAAELNVIQAFQESLEKLQEQIDQIATIPPEELQSRLDEAKAALKYITGIDLADLDGIYVPSNLLSGVVEPLERESERILSTLRYSTKINQTIVALEAYESIANNMKKAEEATIKAEEALQESTGPESWQERREKIQLIGKKLAEAMEAQEATVNSRNETLKEVMKQVDSSKMELDEVQKTADKTLSDAKSAIKNVQSVKQLLASTDPLTKNISALVEQQGSLMNRLQSRLKSAENRYAKLQGTAQSAVDQANGTQTSLVKAITEAEESIKQLDSKLTHLRRLADEARSMLDVNYGALAQDPVPISLDRDCVYSLVPYSLTKSRIFDIEFWFRLHGSSSETDGVMMVGRRAFIGHTQMFAFTLESAGKTLRFSWNIPNGKLELDSIREEIWYQVRVTSMWGETKMMLLERPDEGSQKPQYREVATNASANYPESALMLDRQMEIRIGGANPSQSRLLNPEAWGDNGAEVFWTRLLSLDSTQFCIFNLRIGATAVGLVDLAAASSGCQQPSRMVCQISNYRPIVRDGHIWRTQGKMDNVTATPRSPRRSPPNFVLQRMFFYDFAGAGGYARIQGFKDLKFCEDRLQFQVTPLQRAQQNKMMVFTFFNFDKDYGVTVTLVNGQPKATRWTGGQLYRSPHKAEMADMTEMFRRRVLRKSQTYKPRLRRQLVGGASEEKREVSITQSELTVRLWRLNEFLTTDCNDDVILFVGGIPPGYYAMRRRMLELGLTLTPFAGRIGLTNDKPSQDGGLFLEEYTSTPLSQFGDTQFTDLTQRREAMSLSNVAPDSQYCLRLTPEWVQTGKPDVKELLRLNEKVLGSPWEPGISMTVRFNPLLIPTENIYLLRLQLENVLWFSIWLTPDYRLGIGIPDFDDKLITEESLRYRPVQDPAFGLRELELTDARAVNASLPTWKESFEQFVGVPMDLTLAETEVSIALHFNGADSEQLDVLFDQRVVQSWTIPAQSQRGPIRLALVGPTNKYPITISYLTIGRHLVDFAVELHTDGNIPGVQVGSCVGQLYPRFVERAVPLGPVWIEQGLDLASPPGGRRLRLVALQPDNFKIPVSTTLPTVKPSDTRLRREEDCTVNPSQTAWFDQGSQSYWELTDLRTRVKSTDQPFEFTIGFRAQLSQGTRELQGGDFGQVEHSILAAFNFGPERVNLYLLVSESQIFLTDTTRLLWSSPHLTIADANWHRLQLTIPKNGDIRNGIGSGIYIVFDGRHLWLPRLISDGLPLLVYIGGLPSAWRPNLSPNDNIERVSGLFGCVDEVIINGVELPPTLSGRPPCYDCFSLDPNIYHVPATLDKYLEKNLIPLTLPTVFQDPDLEKLTFDFSFFYDRQESIINSLFMLVFSDNEDLSVEHRVWIYLTNNEVKMVASPSDEEPQDQGHSVTLPNLPRSRNTWHFIKLEMLFLGPTKVFLLRSKGEQSLPLMMLQPMRNLKAIYFGQDMVIKPKLLGPKLHSTPGRPFVGCFRDIRLRTNLDVATLRFPANIPGLLEGVCHTSSVW